MVARRVAQKVGFLECEIAILNQTGMSPYVKRQNITSKKRQYGSISAAVG